MRKKSTLLGVVLSCFCIIQLHAQSRPSIKFGKVSVSDFEVNSPLVDSNVNAVVLADIGLVEFIGDNAGGFNFSYKKHTRIKILNRKGFNAADVSIPLYQTSKTKEKIYGIKGYTYRLKDGQVTETKLENKTVFEEKLNDRYVLTKFTMPDLADGVIIEYTYTVTSEFLFNLQPWEFQGQYPRLWSELEAFIPEYFGYAFLSQGYLPYYEQKEETTSGSFQVIQGSPSVNLRVNYRKWVMKDVPAMRPESFTSNIDNHIAKIEFQLSYIKPANGGYRDILSNWSKVSEELLDDESFGFLLNRNNGWMDEEIAPMIAGATTNLDKARKIYAYLRDNFAVTGRGYRINKNASLKDIFKRRNGTTGEINLLLIALLKHLKIDAQPLLLSTKDNGFAHEAYPLLSRYNYVICMAKIDGNSLLLDASVKNSAFGKIGYECYNGQARLINKENPMPVYLMADSITESSVKSFMISLDSSGRWTANYTYFPGYYEALDYRNKLVKTDYESGRKFLQTKISSDWSITDFTIDSLNQKDAPLVIKQSLNYAGEAAQTIYFTPLLQNFVEGNPFKTETRNYPVEMPFAINETYTMRLNIPSGYTIDEMPKSMRVKLFENDGQFEYIIRKDEDGVQLRARLIIARANFSNEEYEVLRDFFSYVIKKQSEQIVIKKQRP